MEFSWLSVLFGAFGLGFIKLVWEVVAFLISRNDKKKTDEEIFAEKQQEIESLFNDLISSAVAIQEHIESFSNTHSAARVLIMKFENGGGLPQLGTVQHISVLNEAINPSNKSYLTPIKQDFQNYTIDAEFQRMMLRVLSTEIYAIPVTELGDGFLKKTYHGTDISKIIITPITNIPAIGASTLKGFMIYMTVQFMDDREISPKMETDIMIMKNKIMNIFHEFYIKRLPMFD